MPWYAGLRAPKHVTREMEERLYSRWSDDCADSGEHLHSQTHAPLKLESWSLDRDRHAEYSGSVYRSEIREMVQALQADRAENDKLLRASTGLLRAWEIFELTQARLEVLEADMERADITPPARWYGSVSHDAPHWTAEHCAKPGLVAEHLRLTGLSHWLEPVTEQSRARARQAGEILHTISLLAGGPPADTLLGHELSLRFKGGCRFQSPSFEVEYDEAHGAPLDLFEQAIGTWIKTLSAEFLRDIDAEGDYQTSLEEQMLEGEFAVVDDDGDPVDEPEPGTREHRRWTRKYRQQRQALRALQAERAKREAWRARMEAERQARQAETAAKREAERLATLARQQAGTQADPHQVAPLGVLAGASAPALTPGAAGA